MLKELNFSSFPALTTPRLTLRQLQESDAKALSSLRSNESVNEYVARAKQTSLMEAHAFIHTINQGIKEKKSLYWAICLKEHPGLMGTICLWNFSADNTIAEVGYELDPTYQGKGFMNEALNAVIDYSFHTLRLKTLEAFTHKNNRRSTQLLLKNNFTLTPDRKDEEDENNRVFILFAKG